MREIAFHVFGRDFELKLEPNEIYAQGATIVWIDDAGKVEEAADGSGEFYRGRLEGDPGSWVRLQVRPGGDLAGVVAAADMSKYWLRSRPITPSSRISSEVRPVAQGRVVGRCGRLCAVEMRGGATVL